MSDKVSLMAIVDESLILWDKLTGEDGELPEDAEKLLGINEGKLKDKIDVYCAMIRHKRDMSDSLAKEFKRLQQRANHADALADWLENTLKVAMDRLGTRSIETDLNTVKVQKNGGKLPLKVDCPPESLSEELTVTSFTTKPDNDKIRAKLEAGEVIPGCSLGERGERLVIK